MSDSSQPVQRFDSAHLRDHLYDWLLRYQRAWVDQDAAVIAQIFTTDAVYAVDPFEKILRGREEIVRYWQAGAAGTQRDIAFEFDIWAVADDFAVVHWTASFTRIASSETVLMDGVFRLSFAPLSEPPQCTQLQEWWFAHSQGSEATGGLVGGSDD